MYHIHCKTVKMMMKVFIHEKEGWSVVKNRDWL